MRKNERKQQTSSAARGGEGDVEHVGGAAPRRGVSTGGHMPADAPGELPGDRHGAGTAERGRDRSAGLGEGLPHEGADVPDGRMTGGEISAAAAGAEILDAVEERPPRRGPVDQSADPEDAPPPR